MFINGATPLTAINFPPAWQYVAHACWLESVEEVIAAVEASWRKRVECAPSSAFDAELTKLYNFCGSLPREKFLSERNSKTVREQTPVLSGKLKSEQLNKLMAEPGCFCLRPFENIEAFDTSIPTPPAFELNSERWGGVCDQRSDPTCVAHAICDLIAWSRAPEGDEPLESLCPEFLHYLALQQNGFQNNQYGSRLEYAMSVACEYGLCSRKEFAEATDGMELAELDLDSSQCDALIECSKTRKVLGQRPLPPSAIEEYKKVLSGAEGVPLPVAVELVVFDSWLGSEMTHYAGKITLPLPGEPPCQSSHAMLITGYRDNVSVPGGGYFIVRNSWGENWAAFSPVGRPGYALVPYEYVARFAVASCTVANNVANDVAITDEEFNRKYVVEFKQGDVLPRDQHGNLFKYGVYIGSPEEPRSLYKPDSPENRNDFRERGYAWSPTQRQKNFYPDSCLVGDDFSETETIRNEYLDSLNSNLKALVTQDVCLDGINSEQILHCELIEDANLNELFVSLACKVFGAPNDLPPRREWFDRQRYLEYRLYKFTTKTDRVFYVSVAFATGLTINLFRGPQRTENVSSRLLVVMDEVFQSKFPAKDALHFKALGVCGRLELTDVLKRAPDVVCCEFSDNEWIALDNVDDTAMAPAMTSLRKALKPFARKDVVAVVRRVVNSLYSENYSGNIRVKDVVNRSELTADEVSKAFDDLHGNGFAVYYTEGLREKEKAIRRV
ncbi:MAG: C1 family peptidase [Planctomycetia bacterium]|nr:C1 family peptidase [Planctomycetia bacterium]